MDYYSGVRPWYSKFYLYFWNCNSILKPNIPAAISVRIKAMLQQPETNCSDVLVNFQVL
jgi:hypothetical protein